MCTLTYTYTKTHTCTCTPINTPLPPTHTHTHTHTHKPVVDPGFQRQGFGFGAKTDYLARLSPSSKRNPFALQDI